MQRSITNEHIKGPNKLHQLPTLVKFSFWSVVGTYKCLGGLS